MNCLLYNLLNCPLILHPSLRYQSWEKRRWLMKERVEMIEQGFGPKFQVKWLDEGEKTKMRQPGMQLRQRFQLLAAEPALQPSGLLKQWCQGGPPALTGWGGKSSLGSALKVVVTRRKGAWLGLLWTRVAYEGRKVILRQAKPTAATTIMGSQGGLFNNHSKRIEKE